MNVDHRGFSPLPHSLSVIPLDATLSSTLKWEVVPEGATLWELQFGPLTPHHLPSFQIAVRTFVETLYEKFPLETVGVILYKGGLPPYDLEILADMLHQLGALLPDEVPFFALFDLEAEGFYEAQLFSKELFSSIHLGFRKAPFGALKWGDKIEPLYHEARLGVMLPLRREGMENREIDACLRALRNRGVRYRLIGEMHLTEEWDDLDDLIVFSELISKQGIRKVQGFVAAGGRVVSVGNPLGVSKEISWNEFGAEGFEPPTFCSQSRRASQTALCPEGK